MTGAGRHARLPQSRKLLFLGLLRCLLCFFLRHHTSPFQVDCRIDCVRLAARTTIAWTTRLVPPRILFFRKMTGKLMLGELILCHSEKKLQYFCRSGLTTE
ncbi:hypothetical protein D3C83_14680 [compost metagenome]